MDSSGASDVAGGTLGLEPHAVLWHVPVTLADRIRFYEAELLVGRYGGLMTQGDIAPIRAALRQAGKFLAAGKTRQAEQALTRAASLLARAAPPRRK